MIKLTGKGFNFNEVNKRLAKSRSLIKNDAGRLAVNQFKGNFRAQGFVDQGLDPWQARKKNDRNKKSRAILVQSGHLRNSIRVLGTPGFKVIIGTRGIKYAKRHNEGLAKMPKRQFIGNSRILEGKIHRSITKTINKIWA